MPSQPNEASPIETLRDILGIARALYLDWAPYAGSIELDELMAVGAELRGSYQRLLKARPGTAVYQSALTKADHATQRLAALLGEHTSTRALVRAAGTKLGVQAAIPGFDPNAKVRHRVKRG